MSDQVRITKTTAVDQNGNRFAALLVKTPYSAEFVEDLKDLVPGGDRIWNTITKVWIIDASYQDEIEILIAEHFTADAIERTHRLHEETIKKCAVKYVKAHWRDGKAREKKIPDKDLLLRVMEKELISQFEYGKVYAQARKLIPDYYAWYAGQVLRGKIKR